MTPEEAIKNVEDELDKGSWKEVKRLARLGAAVEAAWKRYDMPNNRYTADANNDFVRDCADAIEQ